MQKSDKLSFRVLTSSGETLANLEYPRETRIFTVIDQIKKKINKKSPHGCQQNLVLRSSLGDVLYPHHQLVKFLHSSNGDHIVAEFETADSKGKSHKNEKKIIAKGSKKSQREMKQGSSGKDSSTDVGVGEKVMPNNGKPSWGSYKIPKKSGSSASIVDLTETNSNDRFSVTEINKTDQKVGNFVDLTDGDNNGLEKRRRSQNNYKSSVSEINQSDKKKKNIMDLTDGDNGVEKRRSCPVGNERSSQRDRRKTDQNVSKSSENRRLSERLSAGKLAVTDKVANSALGSLMQNYTNDDDDEDEEEEEDVQDVCGSILKRAKSDDVISDPNDNDEEEIDFPKLKANKTEEASSTSKKSSAKEKHEEEESAGSGGDFSKGIGNFLNALRSESQKPKQPPLKIPVMQTTGNKRQSSGSDLWGKSSVRTYSSKRINNVSASASGNDLKRVKRDNPPPMVSSEPPFLKTPSPEHPASSAANDAACVASSFSSSFDDDAEDHQLTIETTTKTFSQKSAVASRTRSGRSSLEGVGVGGDEDSGKKEEEEESAEEDQDATKKEDGDDDVWQMDVVLLSIKCKGPITNKQLASCINGIMLDVEAESPAKLDSLTLDELLTKLEAVFQQDLSERKKCVDYVLQKLRRDGLKRKHSSPVMATIGKINVTKEDLYTLADPNWLNDNVINAYLHLLIKVSKKKVFAHSTFFYSNLTRKGYDSVKRWTDQVDLFAQDIIVIPVHLRNHWTLAVIHVQQHRIEYYNSLGSNNTKCLGILIQYLRKEATIRERDLFTALKWSTGFMKGLPQQQNGSDCGVYVCQYAKRICLGKPVKFTTMESMRFRKNMVGELLDGKIAAC